MDYFGYLRYLKIQLEDLKDYQRALSYIGKLDFYEVTCCICNFTSCSSETFMKFETDVILNFCLSCFIIML